MFVFSFAFGAVVGCCFSSALPWCRCQLVGCCFEKVLWFRWLVVFKCRGCLVIPSRFFFLLHLVPWLVVASEVPWFPEVPWLIVASEVSCRDVVVNWFVDAAARWLVVAFSSAVVGCCFSSVLP